MPAVSAMCSQARLSSHTSLRLSTWVRVKAAAAGPAALFLLSSTEARSLFIITSGSVAAAGSSAVASALADSEEADSEEDEEESESEEEEEEADEDAEESAAGAGSAAGSGAGSRTTSGARSFMDRETDRTAQMVRRVRDLMLFWGCCLAAFLNYQ